VSVPLIPTHCFFSVCSVPSVVNCFFQDDGKRRCVRSGMVRRKRGF
jgi:hypothetical protein